MRQINQQRDQFDRERKASENALESQRQKYLSELEDLRKSLQTSELQLKMEGARQ